MQSMSRYTCRTVKLRIAGTGLKKGSSPQVRFVAIAMVLFVAFSLSLNVAYAEDSWVTDEFEVMLRSGKSNQQRILMQLRSGTRLELLKGDAESGYTKVRTASGEEGWVLSRYLRFTPTAKLRLPAVEQRFQKSDAKNKELRRELDANKKDKQGLQREVAESQASNRSLQNQLDRITRLSSNTIEVDDQNQLLTQQLTDAQQKIDTLEADKTRLGSRSDREWFLVGGAVLALGLLLGLVIPRINWRKKDSWSDF
jgi:SH3 domain protein